MAPGFTWPTRTSISTITVSTPSSIATLTTPTSTPTPEAPFPWPQNEPKDLKPPFVAPYLIVPIDSSDPSQKIGNQYIGQISPTRSTLFALDIPPTSGKTCNLFFIVPGLFDPQYPTPYTLNSPGGISVSRLNGPNIANVNVATALESLAVGSVPRLLPGNKYLIESGPCASGQKIGYRVDSVGGLDMTFFQMSGPVAIGLFIEVS